MKSPGIWRAKTLKKALTTANAATVVLACLLFLAGPALGAPDGAIGGKVQDSAGGPVRAAFVRARNVETGITTSVLTDSAGNYQVPDLPSGEYELRVSAAGYKASPRSGVKVGSAPTAPLNLRVESGMVRWSDLSLYQGAELLPEATGKKEVFTYCLNCHGFQRMAATPRDAEGWEEKIKYMKDISGWFLEGRVSDQAYEDIHSYLTATFGQDSQLPRSPAELPGYQGVVERFTDEALRIVYVDYQMPGPGRMPWSAAEDREGNFWLPFFVHSNRIARLNPVSGKIEEFPVLADRPLGVHGIAAAPDGTIWFSETAVNRLAKFDTRTGAFSQYQAAMRPGKTNNERGRTHTIRIDSTGIVWSSGNPLNRFDPKTGRFTAYSEVRAPYGVDLDQHDNLWFAHPPAPGTIGMVDAKTLKIRQWTPPTPNNGARRITVDSGGIVWFTEYAAGKIGRFDPGTEAFQEFAIPAERATPYAIAVDADGYVWASSKERDLLFRLDPRTGAFLQFPAPYTDMNSHEWSKDSKGRIWWASGPNDRVGYFYVAGSKP